MKQAIKFFVAILIIGFIIGGCAKNVNPTGLYNATFENVGTQTCDLYAGYSGDSLKNFIGVGTFAPNQSLSISNLTVGSVYEAVIVKHSNPVDSVLLSTRFSSTGGDLTITFNPK